MHRGISALVLAGGLVASGGAAHSMHEAKPAPTGMNIAPTPKNGEGFPAEATVVLAALGVIATVTGAYNLSRPEYSDTPEESE